MAEPGYNLDAPRPRQLAPEIERAVLDLKKALLQADYIDDLVSGAVTAAEMELRREQRGRARDALRKRRAELESVLLGPCT